MRTFRFGLPGNAVWPHKPVRKHDFGAAEESLQRVGELRGIRRVAPRILSYSTRAPQKPPGIRAILEILCELLVSLPYPRQR